MEASVVVLEPTGDLKLTLADAQATESLPVVVNPGQVRDFARAKGRLPQTDVPDA